MGIIPIRIAGDPVLREKAKRVRKIDGSIQRLIDDMIDTMRAAPGVGLAAPQVGVGLRVVVIETPDDGLLPLINPEVIKHSGERRVMEGCLSIPGYRADTPRSISVVAKGRDPEGKEVRIKATELLAQALEHEIDHINGTLYIDYLESPDELRKVTPAEEQGEPEPASSPS